MTEILQSNVVCSRMRSARSSWEGLDAISLRVNVLPLPACEARPRLIPRHDRCTQCHQQVDLHASSLARQESNIATVTVRNNSNRIIGMLCPVGGNGSGEFSPGLMSLSITVVTRPIKELGVRIIQLSHHVPDVVRFKRLCAS